MTLVTVTLSNLFGRKAQRNVGVNDGPKTKFLRTFVATSRATTPAVTRRGEQAAEVDRLVHLLSR